MIAFLRGRLAESLPNQAIIDVNGVGYHVLIPLSTYDKLPQQGAEVKLLTHYHVTDRDHTLYGFITGDERDLFRLRETPLRYRPHRSLKRRSPQQKHSNSSPLEIRNWFASSSGRSSRSPTPAGHLASGQEQHEPDTLGH